VWCFLWINAYHELIVQWKYFSVNLPSDTIKGLFLSSNIGGKWWKTTRHGVISEMGKHRIEKRNLTADTRSFWFRSSPVQETHRFTKRNWLFFRKKNSGYRKYLISSVIPVEMSILLQSSASRQTTRVLLRTLSSSWVRYISTFVRFGNWVGVITGRYLCFQCWSKGISHRRRKVHLLREKNAWSTKRYLCVFFLDLNSLVSAKQSYQTILPFMSLRIRSF